MRRIFWPSIVCALTMGWFLLAPACVPQLCEVDFECKAPTPHCLVGQCVECLRDTDCRQFFRCEGYKCIPPEGYVPEPITERGEQVVVDSRPELSQPEGDAAAPPDRRVPPDVLADQPPVDRGPPADRKPPDRIAPPDTRPVCKDGDMRPCYLFKAGCSKKGDGSYSCKAPCKAGTQSCIGGKWSKTCLGQVGPGEPQCNRTDRDCDGLPDQCKAVVPNDQVVDYAVNDSGHLMGLTRLGTSTAQKSTLKVHCADSIRPTAVPRTLTLVTTDTASATSTRLLTARIRAVPGKPYFIIAWTVSQTKPSLMSKLYVRTVEVNCKLRMAPRWETSFVQNFSMAVDGSGRLAVMHTDFRSVGGKFTSNGYLRLYDANGTQTLVHSLYPNMKGCIFTGHIAMNTKGQGVVACRNSLKPFALMLHRFSMPKIVSPPINVPRSDFDGLFSYDPFIMPGINEKGDIAVQWQNPKAKKTYVYFRTAAGATTQPSIVAVAGRAVTATTNYGLQTTAQMAVVGDDFVLQSMPATMTGPGVWLRYTPAGKLVKRTTNSAFPSSLRYNRGSNHAYFLLPTSLQIFRVSQPF